MAISINIYLGIKTLHLIFYLLSKIFKKPIILKLINRWFTINTKWWILPISFIESNMIKIAYNSFSQLNPNSTGYFSFDNKINFALTFLTVLIFLTYAFGFYIIFYRFASRKVAHTLLNYAKFSLNGFFVESFSRIFRNFVKGFIHAYFVDDYKTQLICLIASDILFVIIILYFSRSFKQKIIRFLYILYYVVFFIFNLSLYIYYFALTPSQDQ